MGRFFDEVPPEGPHVGRRPSLWERTSQGFETEPMRSSFAAEVCVVGAGIAGTITAYLLAETGLKVILLDDGPVGSGMTARTTAHLSNALDDRYTKISSLHGEQGARLAALSHSAAIDEIERLTLELQIPCGFARLDGYLFLSPETKQAELEQEKEATRRAGLFTELVGQVPGMELGPALRFPNQAQMHPLRFLHGLAAGLLRKGGQIYTGTHVSQVHGGHVARVQTSGGYSVEADAVVVATNTPINDRVVVHSKQAPYATYVIGMRMPTGSFPAALLWDTGQPTRLGPNPYHYVRLAEDEHGPVLLVGGEDHKSAQAPDAIGRFARLEAWARQHFPQTAEVTDQWSGQVMEPVDAMAYIGRNPVDKTNVFIATGDSGNGMTHGAIAGILLRDLIIGHPNPWAELYSPNRKSFNPSALANYAGQNLNVAAQMRDHFAVGEACEEIQPGEGAIVRSGLHLIAAYRDEAGQLHEFSAVCPHLGCVLRWDGVEKTWDCPCHGSRFSCMGTIINGPACENLTPLEQPV